MISLINSMTRAARALALATAGAILFIGCASSSARREPPEIDPVAASVIAMEHYDANHDAFLDKEELVDCPALQAAAKEIDADKDDCISKDEIAERIRSWGENRVALVALTCKVVKGDTPLAGASVKFVPESFLGANVKPAYGMSDSLGMVQLEVEGEAVQGVSHCGFFRVEISKVEGGKETIDERFNSKTTLGEEIREDSRRRKEGIVYDVG